MTDLDRMPRPLHAALGGSGFRRKRRLVLPLLTTDPEGFPRVALLTLGEVRANSASELAVAVRSGSRTELNLVRRTTATLLYLTRPLAASVQARAGHGHVSRSNPSRLIFPLTVERVRLDQPVREEGDIALLAGPTFTGGNAGRLFSEELFEELGKVQPE
jgi:hypothetical protein